MVSKENVLGMDGAEGDRDGDRAEVVVVGGWRC